MAYPVKSLVKLLEQINARWPNRDKSSDGWIGDAAHAARDSQHNPDADGSVDARDFTNDPAHGFDAHAFADFMRTQRDKRIRNIISNRRILAGNEGTSPWVWRPYNGSNPHTAHIHVDVLDKYQDDETSWAMPNGQSNGQKNDFVISNSGKASWYSQYNGKYNWKDTGDKPNSNALGVPDDQQGFAMYDKSGLGKWRDVRAPNGIVLRLQQTDIGPNPNTGRKIDIAAVAAERFGYSPSDFPTDVIFEWSNTIGSDVAVINDGVFRRETHAFNPDVQAIQKALGFSETEQDGYFGSETEKAVQWFQRRNGLEPDGEVGPLTLAKLHGSNENGTDKKDVDLATLITEIWTTIKPLIMENIKVTNLPVLSSGKSWLASTGVWGGIVAILGAVTPIISQASGLTIQAADVQQTVDLISQVVTAVGGIIAIYGRITATKKIG